MFSFPVGYLYYLRNYHILTFTFEVKNGGAITPFPIHLHGIIKHTDSFIVEKGSI
jgi:hypothetical protein